MRRKDREITSLEEIDKLIRDCKVCRLGFVDGDKPYVVPMNYGAEKVGDTWNVYFHSAKTGLKLDILAKNPKVCFEIDCNHQLVEGKIACAYGFYFASVIGEGELEILTQPEEQHHALCCIMEHQTGKKGFSFDAQAVGSVRELKLVLKNVTGKRRDH